MQRKRGRGRRSGGNNNNPNRHYESTGPDVKIRGSAQQILDKYQQYARDALTAGDRVKAEAHFQHAEHYARIVASFQKDKPRNKNDDNSSDDDEDDDNTSSEAGADNESNAAQNGHDKSGPNDDGESRKPKGRGRKPKAGKDDKDDPMRVISNDDDSGNDDTQDTPAADSGQDGDAPAKPRRRTYRKKADTSSENDGVMSTLSRGRSSDSEDRSDNGEDSPASQTEAAE